MRRVVYIASDHGGANLKKVIIEHLLAEDIKVVEYNEVENEEQDYPHFAKQIAEQVIEHEGLGILVCGTGIGMSIAANKVRGIRASLVNDCYSARMTREHNDSNILCLGERVLGAGLALEIVDTWLNSDFLGGRHARRVSQIKDLEKW